ncbi:hypothetical protein CCACVL1_13008 [Corchorus capsularis]|uniref:Uncharacterized protein n=1 Tax=Corchorus capsularis TaxID=210143 RepID=A0A1R3ICU2_COCAP|nr:hypothetical protein CCACVL1_13008 [Corchorus capsularis]
MQLTTPEEQTVQQGLDIPATPSMVVDTAEENIKGRRKSYMASSSSPRPRPRCTCLNHPGSAPCSRHGYMVPRQNMRKSYSANKEILRRALTPPNRKMTLRWWNFRPTPSRLSNMSMA